MIKGGLGGTRVYEPILLTRQMGVSSGMGHGYSG